MDTDMERTLERRELDRFRTGLRFRRIRPRVPIPRKDHPINFMCGPPMGGKKGLVCRRTHLSPDPRSTADLPHGRWVPKMPRTATNQPPTNQARRRHHPTTPAQTTPTVFLQNDPLHSNNPQSQIPPDSTMTWKP